MSYISHCILCKTGKLSEPKLNFGSTALANEFLPTIQKQDEFPLEICVCESCENYQLNYIVEPERLFRHYLYVAGTSPVNVEHFRQYAVEVVEKFNLKTGSKILDIASNDGTSLKHFKNLGMSVLGIDPARNLAAEATKNGIPTIAEFFTNDFADKILEEYGQFDCITANNCFAHLPDLADFAKGVKKLLKPNGVFIFEVSYWLDVCNKILPDLVYHEHTNQHHIKPLVPFFLSHGLQLFDVKHIDNHGGSVRVFVCNLIDVKIDEYMEVNYNGFYKVKNSVNQFIEQEANIEEKVKNLYIKVESLGKDINNELKNLKKQGKSIAIFGFPAKATTLFYALGIDERLIDFAVDDAPLKQGTFSPGKHIPIFHPDVIYERKPDVLLVLAWNFADSIMEKHSKFKGQWIVPLPELRVIDAN